MDKRWWTHNVLINNMLCCLEQFRLSSVGSLSEKLELGTKKKIWRFFFYKQIKECVSGLRFYVARLSESLFYQMLFYTEDLRISAN